MDRYRGGFTSHGAFRWLLGSPGGHDEHEQGDPRGVPPRPRRFLGALARFRDGDAARAEQLGRAWDNFDFQLTKHHEGEHEIAWPALAQVGVTRQMIDQMDAEHEVMAERLSAARASMSALRTAPSAANAQTARTAMDELRP